MKKILIIDLHCDALLPSGLGEFGGGNTYSKSVISTIINTDSEYLYVTRKKIYSLPDEEFIAPNLKYVRIKIAPSEVEDKDILYLYKDEIFDIVLEIMNKFNFVPELIHSIYWPSGIVALKLSDYFKIPFIHTILSNGKRKQLQSGNYEIADIRIKNEKECFLKAIYIICSSIYELEDINKLYGIPYEKLILTGLEVDKSFINPSYNRSGSYRVNTVTQSDSQYITIDQSTHSTPSLWWNKGAFLFYGRLHKDKGIIEIINNWLELKISNPYLPMLWIAGGSPEQIHTLRELISDKKNLVYYENRQEIIWWGRLSAEGLSTLMLKTLVLVTHSRYESGGLMILEAMAHGIPVIATPHGYANDYIEDWKSGFIVPFNDSFLLKKRMLHFMYQPFLSSVMGNNAHMQYLKVSHEFDFSNKHLELYQKNRISNKISTQDSNILHSKLSYPLAEHIPSDSEILSFFRQYMYNNTWNPEGIPILKKFEDFDRYCVWTIEYNAKNYQCFRWKSHINTKRIFINDYDYFYTCQALTETDKVLYNSGAIISPINNLLEYNISIHEIIFDSNTFASLMENFEVIFKSKPTITMNTIDYHHIAIESEKMLKNYSYSVADISTDIYNFLTHITLDKEETGVVPEFLVKHSIINNYFVHMGRLCIGERSYFFALYMFTNKIIQADKIKLFLKENNIQAMHHKNILCWLLNLLFYEASQNIICNGTPLPPNDITQIDELIKLLK